VFNEKRVGHRDLKPENILIDIQSLAVDEDSPYLSDAILASWDFTCPTEFDIKVADFGLSK
jgi:serine/threonine protein kinase